MVDVVLDTDACNEIDDQFAIAYLLRSDDRLRTKAIYAAPYCNRHCASPKEGMENSFLEIQKVLQLLKVTMPSFRGAERYMENERTPVISSAAQDLAERAMQYSPQTPLYVVAIGAITNIASAILLNPKITENIVVVWLGGHARHYHDTLEFNMRQDIFASRVVMGSGAPFVQLPCMGVVSGFQVSGPELALWLGGKNALCDYLVQNTVATAESYAEGMAWSRVIWDVTAIAWLLNDQDCFMLSRIEPTWLCAYDKMYTINPNGTPMRYVYHIKRDELLRDMIEKLTR